MKQCSILLADDDLEDRFIITDSFREIGYDQYVHFVENGEQVMEYLSQIPDAAQLPTLIVLDLNMPRMNGTDALRALKSNSGYDKIQVIIYSTSVNEREKKQCIELGALAYITKPVKYQESLDTAKYFIEIAGK